MKLQHSRVGTKLLATRFKDETVRAIEFISSDEYCEDEDVRGYVKTRPRGAQKFRKDGIVSLWWRRVSHVPFWRHSVFVRGRFCARRWFPGRPADL